VSAKAEWANQFFETNEIVFLSAIGGETYLLLQNLLAPTLPNALFQSDFSIVSTPIIEFFN